jgi:hypothetical protein
LRTPDGKRHEAKGDTGEIDNNKAPYENFGLQNTFFPIPIIGNCLLVSE